MLRLRSSARLLRKVSQPANLLSLHSSSPLSCLSHGCADGLQLCEASRPLGRREVQGAPTRRLSGAASAARTTSLLRPLPGLDLPPSLPDKLTRLPTRVTTLPNGVRVASEDLPVPPSPFQSHTISSRNR
jgi:hypothetical protein